MFKQMNKKAMEMSINLVVTLIIGIIIFGLGMGLFSKISSSGDDQINDLNSKIKNNIASLECDGDEIICSPSFKMRNGDEKTFELFISNNNDNNEKFKIEINSKDEDNNLEGKTGIWKDGCGGILISYPNIEINVLSKNSASVPFIVKATRVSKTPCSFITTAKLIDSNNNEVGKTALIVRVE